MYFMWQIEKRVVFESSQWYWWEHLHFCQQFVTEIFNWVWQDLLCIEKNGELVQTLDCHTG
jgi:uncharacterized membrane protein (GlpM family)